MRLKDIPTATNDEILQNLLDTLTSLKSGHLTARMTEGFPGIYTDIARTLNTHLDTLQMLASEHRRLAEEIGVTGRLGGQMEVPDASGAWRQIVDDMNRLGANLTNQFRDGANTLRDLLHAAAAPPPRMTARSINGEFAAFREDLNRLAARVVPSGTTSA